MAKRTQSKASFAPRPDSLVQMAAERLREIILLTEEGKSLGSLDEVAGRLGVGIVTVQQVARILEQEGLLNVRRGPGGGYYAMRPDETGVERAVATYLRVHGSGYREAIEVALLLNAELAAKAANCRDEHLRAAFAEVVREIEGSNDISIPARLEFEDRLRNLISQMSSMPLTDLIAGVSRRLFRDQLVSTISPGLEGELQWKTVWRRIAEGISLNDEEFVRFASLKYRKFIISKMESDIIQTTE